MKIKLQQQKIKFKDLPIGEVFCFAENLYCDGNATCGNATHGNTALIKTEKLSKLIEPVQEPFGVTAVYLSPYAGEGVYVEDETEVILFKDSVLVLR